MEIIFVLNGLSSGGSERVASILVNKLAERGYHVSVICVNGSTSFYSINPQVDVFFLGSNKHTHLLWKKMAWTRNFVKKRNPQVVISLITQVYGFTLGSLIGCDIPVITSDRNDPRAFSLLQRIIMCVALPMSKHHIVQTEKIKAFYPSFIRKKTSVLPNPVDSKFIKNYNTEKKWVIISVGRLVKQKNQQLMIDAFTRIAGKYPMYSLVIYGEGPLRKQLERYICKLGMASRIILPGRSQVIAERMHEARVYCMSSIHEGMSNALLEAVCCGLPVITTRVSGVEEVITDGVNGLVVDSGDVTAFTKALDRLLGNTYMMAKMGENNRKKGLMMNTEKIVEKWEEIIKNITRKG